MSKKNKKESQSWYDVIKPFLLKREALLIELKQIDGLIKNARTELCKQFYGISYGSLVMHKGEVFQVSKIDLTFITPSCFQPDRKPWIYGKRLKADGEFAMVGMHLMDQWEEVSIEMQRKLEQAKISKKKK